jgi:integrase
MQARSNVRAKKQARVAVDPGDEKRLLRALETWAKTDNFVALRTRAIALLLWDGAVRTSTALAMNVEDVVDPYARRLTVRKRIVLRPSDGSNDVERMIAISARTRDALTHYLRAARKGGWLPGEWLRGPVFLSSLPRGASQRLSQRSAIHWWELFQKTHAPECSHEYELDDLVFSGRLAYAQASGKDPESLSNHAGISRRWAAEYMNDSNHTPQDVMAKLDKSRR